MNNLEEEIIRQLKDIWNNFNDDGGHETDYEDVEKLLLDAISRTRKETIKSVVKKLSELPYHPEFEHYDGGKTERQVTYTTDIVHLENELKRLDQLDKGGKE